ncbi:MAG TPA: Nre family DNA repair protein, partial [Thermoplasmata archaeon]|nr:Nre family DNA repair protein [Thermoplasmata archaeon]
MPPAGATPPIEGIASLPSLSWSIPGLREDPTMCVRCRSAQLLCGKPVCPILVKYQAFARTLPMVGRLDLDGSSPPGVFVGRYGYPKVSLGPLLSPEPGDTLLLDTPEEWVGRSVDEIVGFRTSLVRGTHRFDVHDAERPVRLIEDVQSIALAAESIDLEARFARPPRGHLALSDAAPPFGPTAPVERVRLNVRRVDPHLERLAGDTDASARIAVGELYGRGVRVSRIQRAFSAGTLGRHGRRKFVPTRWSITAVDDLLGLANLERVRPLPELGEFRLHTMTALDNRWFLAFLPGAFRYESIEAWYPNTLWNPASNRIVMMGDHEGPRGRTTYAAIGGCYYAARLAISEKLLEMGRQGGALVFREVHPGEILPLGVWNVREHVRAALRTPAERFGSLGELLERMRQTFTIPLDRWLGRSAVLHEMRTQRRLDDFLTSEGVRAPSPDHP